MLVPRSYVLLTNDMNDVEVFEYNPHSPTSQGLASASRVFVHRIMHLVANICRRMVAMRLLILQLSGAVFAN